MADGPGLSDIVRRTVQANARFYKGWMDLSLEYVRGISEIFGGAAESVASSPVQEMDSGAGALVLEGEAGSRVRGAFLVSNDLERPISCEFVGSDFKDPRGVSVYPKAAFEPPTLALAPGEQRVIQLAIEIDEQLSPGVGYAGEVSIKGMEGFSVPVVLRRQHRVDEAAPAQEEANQERDEETHAAPAPRPNASGKKGSRKQKSP